MLSVFGGYGFTREYPVERYMRDAKITQIYERHQPGTADGYLWRHPQIVKEFPNRTLLLLKHV